MTTFQEQVEQLEQKLDDFVKDIEGQAEQPVVRRKEFNGTQTFTTWLSWAKPVQWRAESRNGRVVIEYVQEQ